MFEIFSAFLTPSRGDTMRGKKKRKAIDDHQPSQSISGSTSSTIGVRIVVVTWSLLSG